MSLLRGDRNHGQVVTTYLCIFCDERFKEKDSAKRHYQEHLQYYPLICSLCGKALLDLPEFLAHHTANHSDEAKGRFKRKERPHFDDWIETFLNSQKAGITAFPPREHCPVCSKVFPVEKIEEAKPRRCTVNRKIDHIHRHLCYLPFECVLCKEEGKEFRIAYFESKAHSHIKQKHPTVDETESRWKIYQKTAAISKLDVWLSEYLSKYGMEACDEKKPAKKLTDAIFPPTLLLPTDLTRIRTVLHSHEVSLNPLIVPSPAAEDGQQTVVEVSPFETHAFYEYLEQLNRSIPYFCIFCDEKFESQVAASQHYSYHMNYKPIKCRLCRKVFVSMKSYSAHHLVTHEVVEDLRFFLAEDMTIERWIDSFLRCQNNLPQSLVLKCSCAKFCPVCSKTGTSTLCSFRCTNHNEDAFRSHVFRHLRYVSYECTVCKLNGSSSLFSSINEKALKHMRSHHKQTNLSVETVSQSFKKAFPIKFIENYVSDLVNARQVSDNSSDMPMKNPQPLILKRLGKKLVVMPDQSKISRLSRIELYSPTPKSAYEMCKTNITRHVRIVGDRVINLPDITMHHKDNPPNFDCTTETVPEERTLKPIAADESQKFTSNCIATIASLMASKLLLCPFCAYKSSDVDLLRKHLMVHSCIPYLCEQCDKVTIKGASPILGDCGAHGVNRTYITQEECQAVKTWIASYCRSLTALDTFEYWDHCDFCWKLKNSGRLVNAVAEIASEYEAHARCHLYYFTSSETLNSFNPFTPNEDDIILPVRKLNSLLVKMQKKFMKRMEEGASVQVLVNGHKSISSTDKHKEVIFKEPQSESVISESCMQQSVMDTAPPVLIETPTVEVDLKAEAIERVKSLKVSLPRISPEKLKTLKVMNDADRIITKKQKDRHKPKVVKDVAPPEVLDAEEIELVIKVPEVIPVPLNFDDAKYFCIFCLSSKEQYSRLDALDHYKEHLDYYPYQCNFCSEVTTNEYKMLLHYKKAHPTDMDARIKLTKHIGNDTWIRSFLDAQRNGINVTKNGLSRGNHRNCVVCEVTKPGSLLNARETISQTVQFQSCLQHLSYLPFKCILCDKVGKNYVLTMATSTAYLHILNKHPENIDDPLNQIFKRSLAVLALDKFLVKYYSMKKKTFKWSMKMFVPLLYKEKLNEKRQDKISEISAAAHDNIQPHHSSPPLYSYSNSSFLPATASASSNGTVSNYQRPMANHSFVTLQSTVPQHQYNSYQVQPQQNRPLLVSLLNNHIPQTTVVDVPHPLSSMSNQIAQLSRPKHTVRLTVDLTPEIYDDEASEESKKALPDFDYFCVFCKESKTFKSITDATSHYAKHFDYRPIVCLLCSKKFSDVVSVQRHHVKFHQRIQPASSLTYFINECEPVENWVTDFLTSQKKFDLWNSVDPKYFSTCLVCDKLLQDKKKPRFSQNCVSKEHIFLHLKYTPYQCIICKHEGVERRFPTIEGKALEHLKLHEVKVRDDEEAKDLFCKVFTIEKLEQLVEEHLILLKYVKHGVKRRVNDTSDNEDENPIEIKRTGSEPFLKAVQNGDSLSQALTSSSVCCTHCDEVVSSAQAIRRHNYTVHSQLSVSYYSPQNVVRN
ncbi:hypothetical protein HDE_06316 [Halotydeus destructor]|nr:hypothetical protein HDE_06316 [Halotydeus destructor]